MRKDFRHFVDLGDRVAVIDTRVNYQYTVRQAETVRQTALLRQRDYPDNERDPLDNFERAELDGHHQMRVPGIVNAAATRVTFMYPRPTTEEVASVFRADDWEKVSHEVQRLHADSYTVSLKEYLDSKEDF